MTAPIVPIERIKRGADRFHCRWLHTNLTAAACVARQDATHPGGRNDRMRPRVTPTHPACVNCTLGRQVRAQVTGAGTDAPTAPPEVPAPAPTTARTCAVEGCPHPVPADAPALALCDDCRAGWL